MLILNFSVKQLVEVSIFVALAVVLDFVAKIYSGWFWPYGGSVSFSLVPIAIIAYRQGWKIGFVSGFLLGIIQLVLGAYILHPLQVLFDYPLPFAVLGLTGLWANQVNFNKGRKQRHYIWLSTLVASLFRLACHVISGYAFFASYAPQGMNPVLYSVMYNFPYVMMSWIASAIVLVMMYRRHHEIITN